MNLINKAMIFAANKHDGQLRKIVNTSYILHPAEVGAIIASITDDEDIIAAGILHDTIEDTEANFKEIEAEFGDRVAWYVMSETENKYSGQNPEDTWKRRKEDSLKEIAATDDINIKIIWLGDKLSNLRSMRLTYLKEGDNLFNYFHQKDKKMHEWYYRTLASYLTELDYTDAYKELMDAINLIFGEEKIGD